MHQTAWRVHDARLVMPPVSPTETLQMPTTAHPAAERLFRSVVMMACVTAAEVKEVVAAGTVREVTVAPGTALAWMALRRVGTRPQLLRPARWDGARPFAAFEFVIDDLKETYTFVIPQSCGNLTLVSRVLLRRVGDIDSNYQFWGGLRYLFR